MKKISLVILTVLVIMSFTMMALAQTDIVGIGGEESVLVAEASKEEDAPKYDYGYEKVTRSYASILRYVYIGIAVLAVITMVIVEKKKFYRKPGPDDNDPNKEESKFDRIFKI